jgi:hypothetical protein
MPLRSRLLIHSLAILLLGMGLAALLAWRSVERLYIATQRENLLAQASLTAAALPACSAGQPLTGSSAATQRRPALFANQQPRARHPYAPAGRTRRGHLQPAGAFRRLCRPAAENNVPHLAAAAAGAARNRSACRASRLPALRAVQDRRVLYAAAPVLARRAV